METRAPAQAASSFRGRARQPPLLFRQFVLSDSRRSFDRDRRVRLRRAVHRGGRARQCDRDSIPSRKKRRGGPQAARQLLPAELLTMLAKRIIPCLDVRDGKVTKGVQFLENVDVGDPVSMSRYYYREGDDEIVFYVITAATKS